MTKKSLYKVLELSEDATAAEIKNAYRRLAMKHHPDKCNDDQGDSFKNISNAYQILSDVSKRARYDAEGDDSLEFFEQEEDMGWFNATSAEDIFLSGAFNFFFKTGSLDKDCFLWETNGAEEEEEEYEEDEDDSQYAENRRERMRDLLKELRSDNLSTKHEALRHIFSHINEDSATITCECIVDFGGIPDLIKSLDHEDSEVRASCMDLLALLSPGYSQALIQCNVMPSLIDKVDAWSADPPLLNRVLLCLFHVTKNPVGAKLYVEADAVNMLLKILYTDAPESVLCASKVLMNLAIADEHSRDLIQAETPKIIALLCSLQDVVSTKSKNKAKKQQKAITAQAQKTLCRLVLYIISMEDSVVADFGAEVASNLFQLISLKVPDLPGFAAQIFEVLSRRGLNIKAQLGDKWPQLVSVITAMVQASDHHPVVGAVAALASWVAMGWTPVTVAITKAFSVAVRSKDVHVVVHATEALTGISQEAPASEPHRKCLAQFADAIVKQMLQLVRFERTPAFVAAAPPAMACLHAMAGIALFQAMMIKAGVFEAATAFFLVDKGSKGAESALGTLDRLSECKLVVDQNLYRDSLRTIKPQLSSPNQSLQLAALRTCINVIQHGGSLLGISPKLLLHLKVCKTNVAEARKLYSLCDVGPGDAERSGDEARSDSSSSGGEVYCDAESRNVFDSLTGRKKKKPKNPAVIPRPPDSTEMKKSQNDSPAAVATEEPKPRRKRAKGYSAHSAIEDLEERFELDMELAMQWSLQGGTEAPPTETVVSRRRKKDRPAPPEPPPAPIRPPEPRRVPPPPRPPRPSPPKSGPPHVTPGKGGPLATPTPVRPPPPPEPLGPPPHPRPTAKREPSAAVPAPPPPTTDALPPARGKGVGADLGKDQWPTPSSSAAQPRSRDGGRGPVKREDNADGAAPPERRPPRSRGGKGGPGGPASVPPPASTANASSSRPKVVATEGAKVTQYMPIKETAAKQEHGGSAAPPSFLQAVVRNLTPLEPRTSASSPRPEVPEAASEPPKEAVAEVAEVVPAAPAPAKPPVPEPRETPAPAPGNAHNLPDGAAVLMEEDLLRQLAVEDTRGPSRPTPAPMATLWASTPLRVPGEAGMPSPKSPESAEPLQSLLEQLNMKDSDIPERSYASPAPGFDGQPYPQQPYEVAPPAQQFVPLPPQYPASQLPPPPYAQRGYEPGMPTGQYVSQEQYLQQQQLMQQQQAMVAQQQAAMQYETPYPYPQQQQQQQLQQLQQPGYAPWAYTMQPTSGRPGAPPYSLPGQAGVPTAPVAATPQLQQQQQSARPPTHYPPPVRPDQRQQYTHTAPRHPQQRYGGYGEAPAGVQAWNTAAANMSANIAGQYGADPSSGYGSQAAYAPSLAQPQYQYEPLTGSSGYQPYAQPYSLTAEAAYAPPGMVYPEPQPALGGYAEEAKLVANMQWDPATQRYVPPPNLAQQVTLEQKMGWAGRPAASAAGAVAEVSSSLLSALRCFKKVPRRQGAAWVFVFSHEDMFFAPPPQSVPRPCGWLGAGSFFCCLPVSTGDCRWPT